MRRSFAITSVALLVSGLATAQPQTDFEDGTSATILPQRFGPGPDQPAFSAAALGMPFFVAPVGSFNRVLPITFIGGNPAAPGAGATTIPTVIVPLVVRFLDGSGTLDATGIVANTIESPVFTPIPFSAGNVPLGRLQYGDAVQRAQFWAYTNPNGISPDYHVLLGAPTVLPPVTIDVPAASGHIVMTRTGIPLGRVDDAFWEPAIVALLSSIHATPDTLPIFLAQNIGLYSGTPSNCCTLGYHNSTGAPASTAQTWIFASWLSAGIFAGFQDVLGLSHEITEWMNDPFVGIISFTQAPRVNWVSPYQLPGQGGACSFNFETGDVVEALANAGGFPVEAANQFVYHLEDAVFIWWFSQATPSPAVNGQYTFHNTLTTPGALCGPG